MTSRPAQALAPRVETFPWLIGGSLVRSDAERRVVVDPASLEPVGEAPLASTSDVDRAVEAAHAAYAAWSLDGPRRRDVLHEMATAVVDEREALSRLLTREQGKPVSEAVREIEALVMT